MQNRAVRGLSVSQAAQVTCSEAVASSLSSRDAADEGDSALEDAAGEPVVAESSAPAGVVGGSEPEVVGSGVGGGCRAGRPAG